MNSFQIKLTNLVSGCFGVAIGILLGIILYAGSFDSQYKSDYNNCITSSTIENVKRCELIKKIK